MITATVRYQLPPHIDQAACRAHFHKIAPGFRDAKGLISKHFIWSESGWAGGVYQCLHLIWGVVGGENAKVPRRYARGTERALLGLLDLVFECVASGELGYLGGRDVDPLLGLRVDSLTGIALLHIELAETGDLDLIILLECVRYDLGERVEELLSVAL